MAGGEWRARAGSSFQCEKSPAIGRDGMVVSNHPLASAAGVEMLAAGGNAIDAAIAALFTLSVVEPMMVGIFGGGMTHLRLADGTHLVIDGLSAAPAAARPDCFQPIAGSGPDYMETAGRANALGPRAVASPGTLKAWCETLQRFGKLPLAEVVEPAIRHAANGFRVTPYLAACVAETAADLARNAEIARLYLPGGQPIAAGSRLVQGDYAQSLRLIAKQGPAVFYGGSLGAVIAEAFRKADGLISQADLESYRCIDRQPVRGAYRGFEIVGPPPPSSGGVHVLQMLNILELHDIAAMGFGGAESLHLLAEVLKIAFADRAAATADPDFVTVPVARLIDKAYGLQRNRDIDPRRAKTWQSPLYTTESANTTHVTVADREGNIVTSTQTINSLFGARFILNGTGIIPNNYMYLFDPHPGHALSIAPGKRITTSQAPLMALKDGRPVYALGLPGGLRIFGSAMQALVNLIDHGMSLQEAVEAPRLWTQGAAVEVEEAFAATAVTGLRARGHEVAQVPHVGGGMNAIEFRPDGSLLGAACWRADGVAMASGGGLARGGVRFWPDAARPAAATKNG